MKKTLASVAAVFACLSLFAAEPQKAADSLWTQDYDAALAAAKENNKAIFLNFTGSDWCYWCKLMDSSVFSKSEWQKFAAEKLVCVKIDFPKDKSLVPAQYVERNRQLSEKFNIRGYPTFVILASDGKTVLGEAGASSDASPQSFIDDIDLIIVKSALIDSLKGKDKEDFEAAEKEIETVKQELTEWLKTSPSRSAKNNKIFSDFQRRAQKAEEKKTKILDRAKKSAAQKK